jgi:hypothetical protein
MSEFLLLKIKPSKTLFCKRLLNSKNCRNWIYKRMKVGYNFLFSSVWQVVEQNQSPYEKVMPVLPKRLQQILALRQFHFCGVDLCSDSISLIDLRMLHPDLHSIVYPEGGNRPIGVIRVTTSASRSHKQDHETILQYWHAQPISSTHTWTKLHISYANHWIYNHTT